MSTNDPYQTPQYDTPFQMPHSDLPPRVEGHRSGLWPIEPGQPPYFQQPPSTNNLAVASLVLGILWVFWIGSVLAVIFGHTALKEIKRRGQSGQGLAVAGLVLGYVGVGTFVLFVLLPLLLAGSGA